MANVAFIKFQNTIMKRLFLLIPALLLFCLVQAQTVDEVISKHLEATGGADKWRAAETVYMEGVAVMQNGNEITSKISKVKDKVLRREIDFGMGSMTMIVTPTKGWYTNPRSGGEFQDMPEPMLKSQLAEMEIHPLLDADKKGNKLELVGKETIDGMEAYKIKLTPTSGQEQFYFIDAKTFNLVRMTTKVMGGGGRRRAEGDAAQPQLMDVVIKYSEHMQTAYGLVFPGKIEQSGGGGMGGGAGMSMEKIEVNTKMDVEKLMKH
jgi:hypothetical protein